MGRRGPKVQIELYRLLNEILVPAAAATAIAIMTNRMTDAELRKKSHRTNY